MVPAHIALHCHRASFTRLPEQIREVLSPLLWLLEEAICIRARQCFLDGQIQVFYIAARTILFYYNDIMTGQTANGRVETESRSLRWVSFFSQSSKLFGKEIVDRPIDSSTVSELIWSNTLIRTELSTSTIKDYNFDWRIMRTRSIFYLQRNNIFNTFRFCSPFWFCWNAKRELLSKYTIPGLSQSCAHDPQADVANFSNHKVWWT